MTLTVTACYYLEKLNKKALLHALKWMFSSVSQSSAWKVLAKYYSHTDRFRLTISNGMKKVT